VQYKSILGSAQNPLLFSVPCNDGSERSSGLLRHSFSSLNQFS